MPHYIGTQSTGDDASAGVAAPPDARLFFNAIVGLRFYLAAWVGLGHALQLSGIFRRENFFLRILLSGDEAGSSSPTC